MKKIKRYFTSTYLKKKTLSEDENRMIGDDLKLFNHLKIRSFSCGAKHTELKAEAGVSDYFVTAAEGAAGGVKNSMKELTAGNIAGLKEDIASMEEKLSGIRERRQNLLLMKESLARNSRSGGKEPIRNFKSSGISFRKDGTVRVGTARNFRIYGNRWLFEHQYLEQKVRELKHAAYSLEEAVRRRKQKLWKLEESARTGQYSVYFGGKKLLHSDLPGRDKLIWRKRYGRMTLSGRQDAAYGNFMVHYDPDTHILSYRGSRHVSANSHFLRTAGPHFPDGPGHIRRTAWRDQQGRISQSC